MFAGLFFSLLTHTSKMIVQIIILQSTLKWSKQESFSNHRGGRPTKVSEFLILTQRQEWTLEMSSVKAPTLWWGQWGESECDPQRSSPWGGRHLCSLCRQVIHNYKESLEGEVVIYAVLSPGWRVLVPVRQWPTSWPGVLPGAPFAWCLPGPGKWRGFKTAQGREKSWQGGARGRGGEGQSCPWGATFLKQCCVFLCLVPSLLLFRPCS